MIDCKNKPVGGYFENKGWYEARNKMIVEDKESGRYTNAQLISKYGISPARIAYIVKKGRS